MTKDSTGKELVVGQKATIAGTVLAASGKNGNNVLIETATGNRLSVTNTEVTVTSPAPAPAQAGK